MLNGFFRGRTDGYTKVSKEDFKSIPQRVGGLTPEENAGIFSRLTFSWFTPMINSACDHILEPEEYYRLTERDSPEYSLPKFEEKWKTEVRRSQADDLSTQKRRGFFSSQESSKGKKAAIPSLARVLFQCFRKEVFAIFFLVLFSNICNFAQIVLLRKLLECIQSSSKILGDISTTPEQTPWWGTLLGVVPGRFNWSIANKGFLFILIMTCLSITYAILRQQETRVVTGLGRKLRSLITGVIYRKLVRMNSNIFSENGHSNAENCFLGRDSSSRNSKARLSIASDISHTAAKESCGMSGNIVNLLSNDVSRFGRLYTCHEFYYGIVSVTIAAILLFTIIGVSGLVGILVILVHGIWSINFLNRRATERKVFSETRDRRILMTSEYLSFIRIIKSYSWENYFIRCIDAQRRRELSSLFRQGIYWGFATACHGVIFHSLLFTIIVRRCRGEVIDPANIFFAYVLYDAVSEFLVSFPKSYALFRDLILSCERVSEFMIQEEKYVSHKKEDLTRTPEICGEEESGSEICSGSVRYNNVELRWPNGALLLKNLTFEVKSGEIMAILGPVGSGKSGLLLSIINELSHYNGSSEIKGKLAYVPQQVWVFTGTIRDNILFGSPFNQEWYDKVISACCLNSDFELFPKGDQTLIGGGSNNLSGGQKQRISLARAVYQKSQIYALDDCLSAVDSSVSARIFRECIIGLLRDKCVILATHLAHLIPHMDKVILLDDISKSPAYIGDPRGLERFPHYRKSLGDGLKQAQNREPEMEEGGKGRPTNKGRTSKEDNLEAFSNFRKASSESESEFDENNIEEGVVTLDTYKKYVSSYDKKSLFQAAIFTTICVMLYVFTTFYIGIWAENFSEDNWVFNISIYVLICITFPASCIYNTVIFRSGAIGVSNIYHDKLLSHIKGAPLSFFENTPIGRILNRFTSDLVHIDELLPVSFNNSTLTVLMSLTMLICIGMVTPQFWVFIPPIFFAFYRVSRKYPPILRQGERRSAALTAPITSHLVETMSGLATIHTFGTEKMLIEKMDKALVSLSNVRYHLDIAYSWLYLRLEVIGSMTFVATGIFSVLVSACSTVHSGVLGTILSFAVAMSGWLRYSIFTVGEFEADMVGFERIRTYTDSELYQIAVPQEEPEDPPESWPSKGKIEFRNVDLVFYPNTNPSLRNISLEIMPGEKIGIVGRTGAGKSSIFSVLLRLHEPSSGNIIIDGIDICKISARKLREIISIVPQEPVIFTGTVRFNLDPKGSYSDEELFEVLKRAHIFEYISGLPGKLDYFLNGTGSQLSVGMKQLFCLARAILRKSKILLLDEATSFVDIQTDALIQQTIKTEFFGCTILTIAHRIKTIADYDRVLVLDYGRILEFDSPHSLLGNPKSAFSSLSSSVI
ncbi:multidrug resistance-associated protein 1-like [Cryptosporidium felis]|nr:multidrug resistance-associated protein 1-like [Cryptosporidium felis]